MNEFVCGDGTRLPVSVRVSSRAKHQRISLSFTGDLEVVVPAKAAMWTGRVGKSAVIDPHGNPRGLVFDPHDDSPDSIKAFLEQHRSWIERAAGRSKQQRIRYEESEAAGLPTHMDFPLCDEIWVVEYRQTQAKGIMVKADGLRRMQGTKRVFALKLSGAIADEKFCSRALIRFIALHAKAVIPSFAWEICREVGASPRSITVNNRKSAWGICTRSGDIRIDSRVLFLPRDLARQVVLHEIAHLKHLNHSQRFYDELFSYEGSSKEAEKAVKAATQFIPAWFIANR